MAVSVEENVLNPNDRVVEGAAQEDVRSLKSIKAHPDLTVLQLSL